MFTELAECMAVLVSYTNEVRSGLKLLHFVTLLLCFKLIPH